MKNIDKLSDIELRTAIANECGSWKNVRLDGRGKLVGTATLVMSEAPDVIPNWPGSDLQANLLERMIAKDGMEAEYLRNLSLVTKGQPATARSKAEAALLTFRASRAAQLAI